MSEFLENLFSSRARARVLRFFLLNPEGEYASGEVASRNLVSPKEVRKEINNFLKMKFLLVRSKKGKKFFRFNPHFVFYPELKNLVVKSNVYPQCKSLGSLRKINGVKLALVSGIFLNYPKSKADLLLVADNLSRKKLNIFIRKIEAELGKEIKYVFMNNDELKYRLNMMDRFLLDFIRGPHDEIVNKVVKEVDRIRRG